MPNRVSHSHQPPAWPGAMPLAPRDSLSRLADLAPEEGALAPPKPWRGWRDYCDPAAALGAIFACADIRFDGKRPWDLLVHHAGFYRRVLRDGTIGFGESYMDGWWDCAAIDELCERAIRAGLADRFGGNLRVMLAALVSAIVNLQTKRRSTAVGRIHYDLGNDFFAAMLDPMLQYSCAYFHGTSDLAEAQERKLDLICRKLALRPGMRLLDIGCGWGGLAKFAAQHYGCEVTGITISKEQQTFASASCRGLPIEVRLEDYRDIAGAFDRAVSVGMLEHVGGKNYRRYMQTVWRHLKDGGLFLCHSIARNQPGFATDPWISKYIFPNSHLPSASQVLGAAEDFFLLEDTQNLGTHYDKTLRAWERRFRASWPAFEARYGSRFYRMWRFYLLSCAGTFRARGMQLFQFVFSKRRFEEYAPAR